MVCSLKSMCIPSFVLISCCVSELHIYVPIVMYCLRLFIVVNFPIPWSLWISISTQSFVSQLCTVIEIRKSKLKKKNNNNNKIKNSENELL